MKHTYQELLKENEILKKKLNYFDLLVKNNADNILIFNKEGKIIFINAPVTSLGYNPSIEEPNIFEMIIPEDKTILIPFFKKFVQIPNAKEKIHYKLFAKDKSIRYIEGTVTNKINSPLGGIVLNYRDVTKRIVAQKSLKAQKEILNSLINSTPDIICFKDGEGRWLEANNAKIELYQIKGVDYKGKKSAELALHSKLHSEELIKCAKNDEITWENGVMNREIEFFDRPGGISKTYDVIRVPIFEKDGKRKGLVVLGRDVTDMHKAINDLTVTEKKLHKLNNELLIAKNKAEESNRLKTSFLANMSHEIRTPMNSILSFSKFLKNDTLDSETREQYINYINQSGNHLLAIINDIIDLSKINANQLKIVESNCELNNFLNRIFQKFGVGIKKENKQLKINWINGLKDGADFISVDVTRLQQIVLNLLSNAVKFTNSGSIDIEYFITEDNSIQFSIKDTGIGISEKDLPIIFDRFIQADISSTREYGGSGLGLSISKSCVELLGGKLWVKSKIGEGSTFYFTIPYNPIKVKIAKEDIPAKPKVVSLKGKSILIVDDDPFNSMILETILKELDATIFTAGNGQEAIDICKTNNKIDLVLMDVQMPVLDGLTATKRILEFRPDLPIVSQSANAMVEDMIKSKEAGCIDYIIKPIDREVLIEKLKYAF